MAIEQMNGQWLGSRQVYFLFTISIKYSSDKKFPDFKNECDHLHLFSQIDQDELGNQKASSTVFLRNEQWEWRTNT